MPRLEPSLDDPPRSVAAGHIKAVARRLFAERGVDGVTVRDIAAAAGQKNHAAVGYHFGSKDALVREILLDGAALIDAGRNARLDELAAAGGPQRLREIVDILILPVIEGEADDDGQADYVRFVVMLSLTQRDRMMAALAGRWNSGYLRCLAALRTLMPPMSTAMQNQRFVFMGAYLGAVLAQRQRVLADASRPHPTWRSDETLDHFAQTVVAMLEVAAPPPGDGGSGDAPETAGLVFSPVG